MTVTITFPEIAVPGIATVSDVEPDTVAGVTAADPLNVTVVFERAPKFVPVNVTVCPGAAPERNQNER